MADRLYIDAEQRNKIDELKKTDKLNISILENSALFLMAVSFGFGKTMTLNKKDGFVQFSVLNENFKSLISTINLAMCESSDDIDSATDFEQNIEQAERYAKAGFEELFEFFSEDDEELLFKRLLLKVDQLYEENIKRLSN